MTIASPPDHLTPDQADIWCSILASLEDDWITKESHDLLAAYCQHVCQQRRLNGMIATHEAAMDAGLKAPGVTMAEQLGMDELDDEGEDAEIEPFEMAEWVKTYDKLLKMLDRENRAMSSLATRLRITNQSLRSNKSDKPARKARPWETPETPEAE